MILLGRDVLDKTMEDSKGTALGTVDDIILELDENGGPMRVLAVEQGGVVLARRIGDRVAAVVGWIAARIGPRHGRPEVIALSRIMDVGDKVIVDPTPHERAELLGSEVRLRRILSAIPGSG